MSERRNPSIIPPHYRPAENRRERCRTCVFDNDGFCRRYNEYPIKPDKVCDSWTPDTEANMAAAELDTVGGGPEVEQRKDYSAAERQKLAKEGKALSDGSYPVADRQDLENAARLAASGHGNVSAAKALIRKRAKELGVDVSTLPGFGTEKNAEPANSEQRDPDSDNDHDQDDLPEGNEPTLDKCEVCDGTGRTDGTECAACDGTGLMRGGQEENAETDAGLERRRRVASLLEGTVERRDFAVDGIEIRETSDGGLRFSGYASTTETPYTVGNFEETFSRGAFKRSLGEDPDVVLLVNHEGLPLARTRSGTMTLSEDTRGLRVDADLDASDPDVQSLVPKMRRGDLTEMSFAFRATDDEWDEDYTRRTVRAATIHRGDVSIVTRGANTTTTANIAFRSDELGLEIRMDEDRAGKKLSKSSMAEIDGAIEHLQKLKQQAEPPEAEPEVAPPPDPAALLRSHVEAARAERARLIARQA